jgi:hypothetical protein
MGKEYKVSLNLMMGDIVLEYFLDGSQVCRLKLSIKDAEKLACELLDKVLSIESERDELAQMLSNTIPSGFFHKDVFDV